MEFSINIPYRKITLKISATEPKSFNAMIELERRVKGQALADQVFEEVRDHQNKYFFIK